jgi:hypothetical protein
MSHTHETITVAPQVRSRILDGEAVVLHLGSGTYFGANEVGSRIWELLLEGTNRASLDERLAVEFEVDRATLTSDVDRFLGELERAGLIVRQPEGQAR